MISRNCIAAITVVLAAWTVSACNPGWAPESQVTDFRILGVKAVPPEVPRGQTSQLTLAYADTMNRVPQVLWVACASAVSATSIMDGGMGGTATGFGTSGCTIVTPPGSTFPVPDFGTTVTMQVPVTGGAPDDNGNEAMTVIGYACAGGAIGLPSDGGTMPTCTNMDGGAALGWEFIRTVPVHPPTATTPLNNNPQITQVLFGLAGSTVPITNDSPPTVPTCADQSVNHMNCTAWNFTVQFSASSREPYGAPDGDGGLTTVTELLTTGYVTDVGSLAGGFRTDTSVAPMSDMEDDWHAPAVAGDAHVYIYVSDGRGGFDFTTRIIHVH